MENPIYGWKSHLGYLHDETDTSNPICKLRLDVALLGIGVQDGAIAHHRRFYLCLENHGASEIEKQKMLVWTKKMVI